MKKILYSIFALAFLVVSAEAKHVEPSTAQEVAKNFISKNARLMHVELALAYTERSVSGLADYYVFGINNNTGFVIVSAEDAGLPIIGYSTESGYEIPSADSDPEFNFWMEDRKKEIEFIRDNNLQATDEISRKWNDYATNKNTTPETMSTVHLPLITTKWSQSGGGSVSYNSQCPGGTLTGCVATAMAQIMKFWKYPVKGTGSSSYTAGSYGTQTANYGATTYNWTGMPLTSSNSSVATIMYQCGVSVNMNYGTSGSGAPIYSTGGNTNPCAAPCAQCAYKTYFGYDPGIYVAFQANYSLPVWIGMVEGEFALGRPIQYFGQDPTNGAHSWVCDGNDASDNMHMVWGWGSSPYDGYYSVTNLNPQGLNFSQYRGGLIKIKPLGNLSGVESIDNAGFNIYPNPANSVVTIEGAAKSNKVQYSLCNMLGAEIKSGEITADGNNFSGQIKVGDMASGMYFLKVTDGDNSFTKKLNKQ